MTDQIETQIRDMVLDICEVLNRNGIHRVRIGALMRLIGLDGEAASALDNDFMDIDDTFIELARTQYSFSQFPPSSYSIQ